MSKSKPTTTSTSKVVSKPVPTAWKDRLNQEDLEELKNTFEVFDQDHSGTIDVAEINKVLEQLGLDKRNPLVLNIINKLKQLNRPIKLQEFIEVAGTSIGQTKTKDGLQKVFNLIDTNGDGVLEFDQLKRILKSVGDNMNDDDILQMMHSTFINKKTTSNEQFTFEEFYLIVSAWANK